MQLAFTGIWSDLAVLVLSFVAVGAAGAGGNTPAVASDRFDVRQFGAVGDGQTDDTAVLLAVAFFLGLVQERTKADSAEDVSKLRTHFIEAHTRAAPEARTVEAYIRALRPDGSWPDIDYTNKEPGAWLTARHPNRLQAMAEAYRKPGHPLAGSAELRAAILKGLEHWTRNDYVNPNWWYNQIGVPETMAPSLILMGDTVPAELREQTVQRVLGRSKMGMTGQNKVWLAEIALMKGLIANDSNLMAKAREQILSELRVTTQEGIQPDYSFHQHGPQQQWGNYGGSFGSDMIHWANIFQGTSYALTLQQLEVLRRYLQEGPAWVLWKGRMDISGCGRQIFRNCQSSKGRSALRQLESMKSLDPGEADAYVRLVSSSREAGANTLVGNKHFWRSDMTVHRRPTWYASVKMSSTRVIGAETCNGENLQGLHLGDGVTCFYRTGSEYENLFPVWDWRRLPGTTCRQDRRSLEPNSKACRGRSDFVSGLSDGQRGIAAMEYIRDSLRARKAWFFLDYGVVCLGAGIDSNGPEPVLTSVNQCALNGRVAVGAKERVQDLQREERFSGELRWVHHDGIGYVFPEPTTATVAAQTQRGDWHRIHSRESARAVERDVFSLWIDHGSQPHDAQYAYVVIPDATVAAMPSLCDSLPVTIRQRTTSALAVASRDGRLVQAVFFEPGRLARGGDSSIEVEVPCLVALDGTAAVTRLHVADPTHTRKVVKLWLSGKYTGSAAQYDEGTKRTEVTVNLPREGAAGRTVSLELRQSSQ
jgi:chondroitin AC lyase